MFGKRRPRKSPVEIYIENQLISPESKQALLDLFVDGMPIPPADYAARGDELMQHILVCHVLAGGSVHADHFAVEVYKNNNREIYRPVWQLEGAAAHQSAPLGYAIHRALKEGTEGLSDDGAGEQTLLCLEKIQRLAHANLEALYKHMLKIEGSAPASNPYL
jgi:hypothetical protein